MRRSLLRLALPALGAAALMTLAACGEPAEPDAAPEPAPGAASEANGASGASGAAGSFAEPALSASAEAALAALGEPYMSANLFNGERLWRRCQSCHTVNEGARHLVGPNLHGMFGRRAGSAEGFRYSDGN